MATSLEPVEFRSGQRTQWKTAAGGWRRWSPLIDSGAGVVSERLVELARVEPGDRVLDVAAGYGEPALVAARRVGPEGKVVATDIAAEMACCGCGLENVRFVEAEAASLDFADGSFDAALSRWGIIFEPEPEATAARFAASCSRKGGWRSPPGGRSTVVPMFELTIGTVTRRLQIPPPPRGTPGPLARPTPEALAALLEGGGFSNVEVEEIEVVFEYESPEEFVACLSDIVAAAHGAPGAVSAGRTRRVVGRDHGCRP